MRIELNQPGMTALHKAGLAGLYMTLQVLSEKEEMVEGLTWELEPTVVTLCWGEDLRAAFQALISKSFRLEDGFIVLTGLESNGPLSIAGKHNLYTALLNSFLQFGKHRDTGTKTTLTYQVDEKVCWIKDFAPIKSYKHCSTVDDFIDAKGRFLNSIEAAGWLYPGGGQRHVAHNSTKVNETPEQALALLFAPIGVVFYSIRSKIGGRKTRLAMVIPCIRDMQAYSTLRQVIAAQGVLELTASSGSDAVLRLASTIHAAGLNKQMAALARDSMKCQLVTFGIVAWNEKQKSRTFTRLISVTQLPGLENYSKAAAIFKNRWQKVSAKLDKKGNLVEPERNFVTTFSAREFISENIAAGKCWYADIADYLTNRDFREQIQYERKELSEMVDKATYENDNEHLFIRVCHESWRRRLGKLGQRASRENANFGSLVANDSEKLRTALARCKNADSLRETVVDFWSRAGANDLLRGNGLAQLLPLFDDKCWKKARDLALLSLISYEPQTAEEAKAFTISQIQEGENNE